MSITRHNSNIHDFDEVRRALGFIGVTEESLDQRVTDIEGVGPGGKASLFASYWLQGNQPSDTTLSNRYVVSATPPIVITPGANVVTLSFAGFGSISPLTTKGDLLTHNGASNVRMGVGADGTLLAADSGETSGLAYATIQVEGALNFNYDAGANLFHAYVTVDNSTIERSVVGASGVLRIKDLGVGTAKIAADAVTYAKIQNVTGDRILGRLSTTGDVEELTAAQVKTLLALTPGTDIPAMDDWRFGDARRALPHRHLFTDILHPMRLHGDLMGMDTGGNVARLPYTSAGRILAADGATETRLAWASFVEAGAVDIVFQDSGGVGGPTEFQFSVKVDNATIEISADALRVKDNVFCLQSDWRLGDARQPLSHRHRTTDIIGLGTAALLNTPIAIVDGGTGQTVRDEAFDALAPAASGAGDDGALIAFNGTASDWVKRARIADGKVFAGDNLGTQHISGASLTDDGVGAIGITWVDSGGGGPKFVFEVLVDGVTIVNFGSVLAVPGGLFCSDADWRLSDARAPRAHRHRIFDLIAGGTSDGTTFLRGDGSWAVPGGGASSNSFVTIDCPSGTDPVADSATDTLQLLAGPGMEITGDSAADSVTFKADTYIAVGSQALTAGSAIAATDGSPYAPVTSSGNITLTSQPTIAAGRNGQAILVKNTGAFNITLQDVNTLGGSLLRMTANTLTIQPGGTMKFVYDSTIGFWIEQYILNPQVFTPSIASFTMDGFSAATHEVGGASSAESPTDHDFALTYVGTPSACTIDISGGEIVGTDYPVTVLTPFLTLDNQPNFYRNTTVGSTRVLTATATVAGQSGLTRTVTVTYTNRRYIGPSTQTTTLTTAQVLLLDDTASGESDLTDSRIGSFSDIDTAAGEYIWFAVADRLDNAGATHFTIEGEVALFTKKQDGTLSHTNDFGFVENFTTWRSELANLGSDKDVATASTEPNNRIYMGPAMDTDPITNNSILALDDTTDGESIVSSTLARTYTAIKIETSEYLWFCHPDRIADLATIKDGTTGFAIAGSYRSNVNHTNQWGYQETYRCWRSDNTGIYPSGENVVVT